MNHNHSFTRIVIVVLTFAFIAPLMLTADAAAKEETLRMLVWEGYAPQEFRAKFIKLVKEKYGVDLKLEVKFVNANDDFFPALKAGDVDIFSPSHPVLKDKRWKIIKLKLALPLNLDNIPNYKNVLPSLQNADYCTVGGKVYAVPHVRGPYGLAYNTERIKKAPESWNILWDPQYKDKYTLGKDAYIHNVTLTALANGVPKNKIYDYRSVNTPEIQGKLANLATHSAPMWVGVDDPDTLKGLSLAVVWGFSLPALREKGETWKIAEPVEGTTGWVDNFALSYTLADKPELKKIAEEWLNFVLSDEYQVYDVRGLACGPVTTSVKAQLTSEEIAQFHLDDPTHFEKNRILWAILDKKDRKGLKRLWNDALKKAN